MAEDPAGGYQRHNSPTNSQGPTRVHRRISHEGTMPVMRGSPATQIDTFWKRNRLLVDARHERQKAEEREDDRGPKANWDNNEAVWSRESTSGNRWKVALTHGVSMASRCGQTGH